MYPDSRLLQQQQQQRQQQSALTNNNKGKEPTLFGKAWLPLPSLCTSWKYDEWTTTTLFIRRIFFGFQWRFFYFGKDMV
ncbi:hypothetical protein BGZ96_000146 [Linnemannia gamsii]|uniref:Uncharacterized protein n=1 Tax=Linnemannia gamsii TaxID=64522 RepID=A0ABQ7JPU7_9FUNG|nr:hypothetical protein BGZ96_000146 [Linnemannia gamsii]